MSSAQLKRLGLHSLGDTQLEIPRGQGTGVGLEMESGSLRCLGLGEEALEKSDQREDPPSPGRKAQQDTTPMSLRRLVSKQRTERRQAEKAEWQRVIKDAGKPCRGQLSESLGLASGISLVTLVKLLSMASRRGR